MLETRSILVFLSFATLIECAMEPFVVGGKQANIRMFPHSAFMYVQCFEGDQTDSISWICGGSIVNEKIVLTAAHCVYGCSTKSTFSVSVGHKHLKKGVVSSVLTYIIHEKYSSITTTNDIALVRLKSVLSFGKNVKRIALMEVPPYYEKAQIAGWGMIDEDTQSMGMTLKYVDQWVWKVESCRQVIHQVQKGTICASSGETDSYSSRCILVFMTWIALSKCQMEPFVVGGEEVSIRHFPHSAFMSVTCSEHNKEKTRSWTCGGSIVNEKIILTAAHCLFGCTNKSMFTVSVGHGNKKKGHGFTVSTYLIHKNYNPYGTINDIGLMKLKTNLKFGKDVKRVALMNDPPYNEKAQIAGWGMIDEDNNTMAVNLNFIDQYVWKIQACKQVISSVPKGALCASSGTSTSFSSRGDSGSALVVRGYIQIGIVSYKMPNISKSLVVYTDTGYFYEWIRKNSKKLYCVSDEED